MNNIDDEIEDLIDNFEIKPITDGLGFHHSLRDKKGVKLNLQHQKELLQNDFENRLNQIDTESNHLNSPVNMGELAPFYNAEVTKPVKEELNLEKSVEQKVLKSSLGLRFCAWGIDIVVLLTVMTVTFASIIYFSDLPMEIINLFMVSDELVLSFGLISILFYVFYFSFLDKTSYSTLGKKILNLRVISTVGEITLMQAFSRSCFSLISIPLLGLPIILKIHDRFTDTCVINK